MRLRMFLIAPTSILMFAVVAVSAQHQKTGQQHQEQAQQQGLAPTITVNNQTQPAQKCQSGADRPTGWHKFVTWPDSWTAWALVVTLLVVGRQAILMRQHAEELKKLAAAAKDLARASKDTSEATNKQVDFLVTSERAWIIVSSRFPDGLDPGNQNTTTRFRWEFKNVGKSPARLLEFNGVARRGDRLNISFPEPAPFSRLPQPLNKLLLVPTDSWGVTWEIDGDAVSAAEFDDLRRWEKLTIISYGYIKYMDAFGKEHTTRFCQETWFDRNENKMRFHPKIEAPTSYTDCD
jgi:hypothetical protein